MCQYANVIMCQYANEDSHTYAYSATNWHIDTLAH